jgi:hypothetical protein
MRLGKTGGAGLSPSVRHGDGWYLGLVLMKGDIAIFNEPDHERCWPPVVSRAADVPA